MSDIYTWFQAAPKTAEGYLWRVLVREFMARKYLLELSGVGRGVLELEDCPAFAACLHTADPYQRQVWTCTAYRSQSGPNAYYAVLPPGDAAAMVGTSLGDGVQRVIHALVFAGKDGVEVAP